jgi:hypothetical protein
MANSSCVNSNLVKELVVSGGDHQGTYISAAADNVLRLNGEDLGYRITREDLSTTGVTYTIQIRDNITNIGSYIFQNCTGLTSLTLGNSVTSIGNFVINQCTSLTSLTIPNGISIISDQAFHGCPSLTSYKYVLSDGSQKTVTLQNPDFSGMPIIVNGFIYTFTGDNVNLVVPNSVTKLMSHAFFECTSLKSIIIPDSVTNIGSYSFSKCTGLQTVELPNTIRVIEDFTFNSCNNLLSVTFPDSVTIINKLAFYNCYNLLSVTFSNDIISIASKAFYRCSSLQSITFNFSYPGDSNIITINNVSKLPTINGLGENITYEADIFLGSNTSNAVPIQDAKYVGCIDPNASNYDPQASVDDGSCEYLGCTDPIANNYDPQASVDDGLCTYTVNTNNANGNCVDPSLVEILDVLGGPHPGTYSLAVDNKLHLDGSASLHEITEGDLDIGGVRYTIKIRDDVTSIQNFAFQNCTGLTSIIIGNNVTTISYNAFYNCTSLTSVTIPNSVTVIVRSAFNLTGLTEYIYVLSDGTEKTVTLQNPDFTGMTIILAGFTYTFTGDNTNLVIPNSVTSIMNQTFYGNTTLTSVTIPDSVTNIGSQTFHSCSNLHSVIIGNNVPFINTAFHSCSNLESVIIGNNVTSIGSFSFMRCYKLNSIIIPDKVELIGFRAFEDCISLESIIISNSIKGVGEKAFYNCYNLSSITFNFSYPGESNITTINNVTELPLINSKGEIIQYSTQIFEGSAEQNYVPSQVVKYIGCIDPTASNYDPQASVDDGSCEYLGCTDSTASNYDPSAQEDDGSCEYLGCTDSTASNYDPSAQEDDGSCEYSGCTNPLATNYNPLVSVNDGSCTFNVVIGAEPITEVTTEQEKEYINEAITTQIDNTTTIGEKETKIDELVNQNPVDTMLVSVPELETILGVITTDTDDVKNAKKEKVKKVLKFKEQIKAKTTTTDEELTSEFFNIKKTIKEDITTLDSEDIKEAALKELKKAIPIEKQNVKLPISDTAKATIAEIYGIQGAKIVNKTVKVQIVTDETVEIEFVDNEVLAIEVALNVIVPIKTQTGGVLNLKTEISTTTTEKVVNYNGVEYNVGETILTNNGDLLIVTGIGSILLEQGMSLIQRDASYADFLVISDLVTNEDVNVVNYNVLQDVSNVYLYDGESLLVEISGNTTSVISSVTVTTDGSLNVTLKEDAFGTDTITLKITSSLNVNDFIIKDLSIQVTGVNDAPTTEDISGIEMLDNESKDITIIASDVDNTDLSYLLVDNIDGKASISGNIVTYSPELGELGLVTIPFTVSDGSLNTSGNIYINVSRSNTAPTIEDISNVSLNEGESTIIDLSINDTENNITNYDISYTNTSGVLDSVTLINNNSQIIIQLVEEVSQVSTETVTLTVSDIDYYVSVSFNVTAYPVNDAPTAYLLLYDNKDILEFLENKLTADDGVNNDQFGNSVAISGNTAIIGAYRDDDKGGDSGSAYIFENVDGSWNQVQKLTAIDGSNNDCFGYSVAISGNTAIVGAFFDVDNGFNSGSAYIFENVDGSWNQVQKITASDGAEYGYFGGSVAISGNTAIVGANGHDLYKGSAYIFGKDVDGSWNQVEKLTASDGADLDKFGKSVAISGNTAIVGAYGDDDKGDDSGSAYIFENIDGSWNQVQKITADDGTDFNQFGYSVAISGNTAIVGADAYDLYKGSAYIFGKDVDGSWNQVQKLTASDGDHDDYFGHSVAISGNTAIVGVYGDDNKGSAYIFENVDGSWNQVQKITASDGDDSDYFGKSVAISGNTAIVGAYYDDDKGDRSGSAYIFTPYITTQEDVSLNIILQGSDVDGDNLTYSVVDGQGPSHGTLSEISGNVVTYTPNPNFNGEDSFQYQASDGSLNSTPATVTIYVEAVNDVPTITEISNITINEGESLDIPVTITDVEGGYTVSLSQNPVVLQTLNYTNGNIRAIAREEYASDISTTVTVTVTDGDHTVTESFIINITSINDLHTLLLLNGKTSVNEGENIVIRYTVNDNDLLASSGTYTLELYKNSTQQIQNETISGVEGNKTISGNVTIGTATEGSDRTETYTIKIIDVVGRSVEASRSITISQVRGCTNPSAANYNSNASLDDGGCFILGYENGTLRLDVR